MTEITAAMVRELREKSGAGMMECKKALTATDGDLEAAFDELRKSGLKTAAKKAGRSTSEGRIVVNLRDDGKAGAMASIACETDFVAKTPDFEGFLADLGAHVLANAPADVEACLAQTWKGGEGTVGDALGVLIGKLGENMQIAQVQAFENPEGYVGAYVHHDSKKGTLVSVTTGSDRATADPALKKLGMHVVFHDPLGMERDSVPADLVEREKEVIRVSLEGKPPEIQEKILSGKIDKFFAERVLLEQAWIDDDSMTVEKTLVSKLGEGTRLEAYSRFQIGA